MTGIDLAVPWHHARWAVVDVEGNGQRPPDLVEIAVVTVEGGAVGTARTWLVKPPRRILPMARRFHGITDQDVADKPTVAEVAEEIARLLRGAVFVAHNAHIDLDVITREIAGFAPDDGVTDTLKLARRLIADQPSYKLGSLVGTLGLSADLPIGLKPHRAEYDALVCARLLVRLAAELGDGCSVGDLLTGLPRGGGEPGEPAALF